MSHFALQSKNVIVNTGKNKSSNSEMIAACVEVKDELIMLYEKASVPVRTIAQSKQKFNEF